MFSLIVVPYFTYLLVGKAVTVQEWIESVWMIVRLDAVMLGIGLIFFLTLGGHG